MQGIWHLLVIGKEGRSFIVLDVAECDVGDGSTNDTSDFLVKLANEWAEKIGKPDWLMSGVTVSSVALRPGKWR